MIWRQPVSQLLPAVACAVVCLLSAAGCETEPPPEGKSTGNRCPEISGFDCDGKLIRLSDYKGKVVLVNFWGTWCGPCLRLIPHEREMVQSKYQGRPFVLLGIAADSTEDLKSFLKSNPLLWPNIADGRPGVLARQWNVEQFPSAILVDHQGVISAQWFSGFDPDDVWVAVERTVRAAER